MITNIATILVNSMIFWLMYNKKLFFVSSLDFVDIMRHCSFVQKM